VETCAACGAPLADDQRYCLECGERRMPMSSVLLSGPPSGGELSQAQPPVMVPPANGSAPAGGAGRGSAATVIAGVGVLLLAMGVGVLIGRSSASSKLSAAPAQVITVAPSGALTTPTTTTPTTPHASTKGGSSSKNGTSGAKKGGSGSSSASPFSSGSTPGASENHPAPPTVVQGLAKKNHKSYEQESKNLPNVISTG
jgi:hypothetical protein